MLDFYKVTTIIELFLNFASIWVTIYFWHHTIKEIRASRRLKKLKLFEYEYSADEIFNLCKIILDENPNAKNPFKVNTNEYFLFNVIKNTYK